LRGLFLLQGADIEETAARVAREYFERIGQHSPGSGINPVPMAPCSVRVDENRC
jgi:hypothetical protein